MPIGDTYVDTRDGSRWTMLYDSARFRGVAVVALTKNGARKWVPLTTFAEYYRLA